ncbi:MAG TPA: DUF1684 domain-containing protein [Caldithrix abyssi]|uniref:DUF1684 domain-containing protein n=1 Tax=Caldithrix abyssi TaxID=187145 RepID=A0A7V4UE98_CALAY|nr:DUF1684 domain-containing protein [Caldithrix abyssi]
MRVFIALFSWVLFFLTVGCDSEPTTEKAAYFQQIENWHKQRIASLTKKDGWLTLAGLFWLEEGESTFGSAEDNKIVFPKDKAPAHIGRFIVKGDEISVKIDSRVTVLHDGQPVQALPLQHDLTGKPTILTLGSLSWYVIKRGDRYLIRLKDSEHPRLKEFKGIERYPVDVRWRVKARLEPYNPPKKLHIANVLGQVSETDCPGALVFEIDGKEYRLDPEGKMGEKEWFLNFSDETSGRETYGAGRYLVIDAPDENGITYIDFNKAYNPPCAFSPFATCPLPPKQNKLLLRITAGEKDYGHH